MNPNPLQRPGNGHRLVPAVIVHQNDLVHDPLGMHLRPRLAQGPCRIVGGHHHDDFSSPIHRSAPLTKGRASLQNPQAI